jgi:hypothetical protein
MNRIALIVALTCTALLPVRASASPLLTITCHDLKGSTLHYGVPFGERIHAKLEHQQMPEPHIVGPKDDSYDNTLTIVVDSASPRKMTIVWNESAATQKVRAEAKKIGMDMIPPTVNEARIVSVNPDMFAAIVEGAPQGISLYTFFPSLGTVFLTSHGEIPDGTDAVMTSVRGACQFSGDPYRALL